MLSAGMAILYKCIVKNISTIFVFGIDIVSNIGYDIIVFRIFYIGSNYKDGKNMDEAIILLAVRVYGKGYADLLREDLSYYSDKDKREALSSLKEQAQEKSLNKSQRRWLTSNTTY